MCVASHLGLIGKFLRHTKPCVSTPGVQAAYNHINKATVNSEEQKQTLPVHSNQGGELQEDGGQ